MAQGGVRAIIFDIGRVLVRLDVNRAQEGLANGSGLAPEELWRAIEKDPLWKDWQVGRISPRDWHLNLTKRLGVKLNFEEFVKTWNAVLDPQPIHPDSFFAGLARHYRLGLLSNTDAIHVPYLESQYSFYKFFPKPVRVYSCVAGVCKPDPRVFQLALKACKVKATEAVYIDDIAAFAEAAGALGMHGIQYASPGRLGEKLQELGVTVE